MARIAIIDDKEILRDSLISTLARDDYQLTAYADPVEAVARIKSARFDLIITDLKMPRMDGLTVVRSLRSSGCEAPVIVMTAYGDVSTAVEAMKAGAFDFIQKPFEADAICMLVERALEHRRLQGENEALRVSLNDLGNHRHLIGQSPSCARLRAQIERVANSHATVLISGESGVGKELVATRIHEQSPRKKQPMLCLNCAALSANLLESELFGHEKGAFTGADRTRKGRFEIADGGTLLLDEISEMELSLQAKLLRVLQEGKFERVGSSDSRSSDVRIIATTNRNLREWVARGRFREDLFYRLNVLPIEVPALRERREDIEGLARFFLGNAARHDEREAVGIEPDALALLTQYDWPGNVRELENFCTRATTLCTTNNITRDMVQRWVGSEGTRESSDLSGLRDGCMLADMERRLVQHTLDRFSGHRAKSAKALGMGVRTLTMKLKKWREEGRPIEARCRLQPSEVTV